MDAADWDARYASADLVWSVAPNQFVEAECADLPPGRAVDLAAGEGRNAIWLASRGWQVTAVDYSAVALEKGRKLAATASLPGAVEWVVGDVTTWSGTGLDLALMAYVHLDAEGRGRAVRAAYNALAPGGTFLLVAHDTTNLTRGTGGPQDPSVLMSADDVLADLGDRDFEVVRAELVERVVVTPTGSHRHEGEHDHVALDCLVRVTRR